MSCRCAGAALGCGCGAMRASIASRRPTPKGQQMGSGGGNVSAMRRLRQVTRTVMLMVFCHQVTTANIFIMNDKFMCDCGFDVMELSFAPGFDGGRGSRSGLGLMGGDAFEDGENFAIGRGLVRLAVLC